MNPSHWIIRVGDGLNFRNGKNQIWGINKGKNNKPIINNKFKNGDILWFLTSKNYGGKFIGMAEYTHYYDRDDELDMYTISNEEQGWVGDERWALQIHFKNEYMIEKQNIRAIIQSPATILNYNTWRERLPGIDLYNHYVNFKFYAEPISNRVPRKKKLKIIS